MILNENVDRKIIPVAGGKGGVGKSVLAANMALSLAMFGKKTVLVDLDLGASNLHTMLGIKNVHTGVGNFLSGGRYRFDSLLVDTPWENLQFIPGDVLVYGMAELTKARKSKVTGGLLELPADYVIVDLGAGNNFTVVDFFLVSNSGLVVTVPQATAIMNAYAFLKNTVFRFLQRAFASNKAVTSYLRKILKEPRPGARLSVSEMIDTLAESDPVAAEKAEVFLEVLQPKLVINKTGSPDDITLAEGLRNLCRKNLKLELECLGTVMMDPVVDDSIDDGRPYVLDYPDALISEEVHRMSQKIIQSRRFPEMPLELDYYADSFELAHIEVENDLAQLQSSENDGRLGPSADDVDKLMEIISLQQEKINELQGTLRMLTINRG